ncbi:MAG: hypothetical protein AAGI68_02285 [Planctomycetota bacterium]
MSRLLRDELERADSAYRGQRYAGDLADDVLGSAVSPTRPSRWRIGLLGGVGLGMAAAIALAFLLYGTGPADHDLAKTDRLQDTVLGNQPSAQPDATVGIEPPPTTGTAAPTPPARTRATPLVPPRVAMDIRRFALSRPSLASLTRRPDLTRSDRNPLRLTRPKRPPTPRPAASPSNPSNAPATGASRWFDDPSPVETS